MNGTAEKIIKIDLDNVLRERIPGVWRFTPRPIIRRLERLIRQDEMNGLLESNAGRRDGDFCRGVMEDLKVTLHVEGEIPPASSRRMIIVCNHPLGGLDGIAIIDWATRHFGGKLHFVVNDLLMAIEPLRGVFLPVNKHGRQNRERLRALDEAMAGDDPVVIFPAGLVSRRGDDGTVADLEWKKMFAAKAVQYNRPVIPAFFSGLNSPSFYKFARRRKKLGIKFNIEMVLLPREVFRSAGKSFTLTFGSPVSPDEIKALGDNAAIEMRRRAYALSSHSTHSNDRK